MMIDMLMNEIILNKWIEICENKLAALIPLFVCATNKKCSYFVLIVYLTKSLG